MSKAAPHPAVMKPAVALILTALAEEPRHGYAISVEVLELSGGRLDLGTSHLYRHLKRLLDLEWIEESTERPPDDDPRRRYYRLAPLGRQALAGEMHRLAALVRRGERLGLVSAPGAIR